MSFSLSANRTAGLGDTTGEGGGGLIDDDLDSGGDGSMVGTGMGRATGLGARLMDSSDTVSVLSWRNGDGVDL